MMKKLLAAVVSFLALAALAGAASADTAWVGAVPNGAACDLYGNPYSSEVLCINRTGTSTLFRFVDFTGAVSLVSAPAGTRVLSPNWKPYGDSYYANTTTGVLFKVVRPGTFNASITFVPDAALSRTLAN